jgi:hypothetical protein
MKTPQYIAAAARIAALAARVNACADAQTPRERAARTRAINALAHAARRLFQANAGLSQH